MRCVSELLLISGFPVFLGFVNYFTTNIAIESDTSSQLGKNVHICINEAETRKPALPSILIVLDLMHVQLADRIRQSRFG